MPETSDDLHEVDGDNASMFARILDAIKEAETTKIVEKNTSSVGQVILFNTKTVKFYKAIVTF
jgi:hypothetical protein